MKIDPSVFPPIALNHFLLLRLKNPLYCWLKIMGSSAKEVHKFHLVFCTWNPHPIHRIHWDLVLDIGRPLCARNNSDFEFCFLFFFHKKCSKLFPFVNSKFYHANNRFNELGHVKYMYFAHFCLLVYRSTSIFLK